jgi:predicted enzyme related to lactoylglutathione lyase
MRHWVLLVLLMLLPAHAAAEIRWFSLATEDVQEATAFYSALFGWTMERSQTGGFICFLNGVPVAGISEIEQIDPDVDESQWVPAMLVADVAEAQAKAVETGAELVNPIEHVRGWGEFALLMDPHEAPFIIARLDRNVGGLTMPGTWVWADLWAKDVDASVGFYRSVLDYETRLINDVLVFTSAGTPEASIMEIRQDHLEQGWAPYIGVSALVEAMEAATSLGGKVLVPPDGQFRDGKAALLMDPAGAAFFVYELGEEYR